MALQLRRGTNAQRGIMTPANGEIIFVTDYALDTTTVDVIDTANNILECGDLIVSGQQIKFLDDSQNGLIKNQVYFSLDTSNDIRVSLTYGGPPVDITGVLAAPIQFALSPTFSSGAPVGLNVPPLWIGDGLTVGGVPAAQINLNDLFDVQIAGTGGVALANYQHLQYDNDDQLWRNVSDVVVPGTLDVFGNTTLGDSITDEVTFTSKLINAPNDFRINAGNHLYVDTSTGFVGMGNDTPAYKLDVTGSIRTTSNLFVDGNTTLGNASGDTVTINASTVAIPNTLDFDSGLLFLSSALNYVGINQASPSEALDVIGNGKFSGDVQVVGGDLTTTSGTATLFNTNATTVNIANAGTSISIGAATGTTTINNTLALGGSLTVPGDLAVNGGDITTTASTATIFNANATTVDAFEAATTINIGAATGTTTIQHNLKVANVISTDDTRNATNTTNGSIQTDGGVSVAQDIFVGGLGTITGDLAVNGGDLTTTAGTATVFNTTATTVNIGGAATTMSIGNGAGTVTIPGNLTVNGTTTTINSQTLLVEDKNITIGDVAIPTDVTASGGGITLLGATDKTITWNNATDGWEFNQPIKVTGDIAVNGGDVTTTSTTGTLFNTTATTVNIAGAATTVSIGANTGTTTINNDLVADALTVSGDLAVNGGDITTTATTATIFNATATTLNIGGAATAVAIGAATGSTIINADLNVNGTTLTLDANNAGAGANSVIAANRGSSGADATLTWIESTGFWTFSNDVFGSGQVVAGTTLATNGNDIYFNNEDGAAADCFITVKRPGLADPQIKWNETSDRWQTTVDASTYLNIPNQNLDSTDSVAFGAVAIDARADIDTATLTTTAITQVPLTTSTRNVMKCVVYIVQGTDVHTVEALVLRTGASTALVTTYGEMYNTSALATFAADTSGGAIRLLVTPANTTSMLFTSVITSLT